MNKVYEIIAYVLLVIVGSVLFAVVGTVPFWMLYNWICPTVFNLNEMTFFQSFGFLIMVRILIPAKGDK